MAQVSEPCAAYADPKIRDAFLTYARRERLAVSVHLVDGRRFDERIKHFDRFAVLVEVDRTDHLVFKHAISTIAAPHAFADYCAPRHP